MAAKIQSVSDSATTEKRQAGSRTIFLHIGLRKTGTSALQSYFARNVEAFREHGVYYPSARATDAARNKKITSGNAPELYLKAQRGSAPEFLDRVTVDAGDHETVLLSSEFLGELQPGEIEHLVRSIPDGWNPKVLCFVRDVYPLLWSAYGQQVKGAAVTRTFINYIAQPKHSYSQHKAIRDWSAALEPGQLHVAHYESHATDLMKYVAGQIGVPYERTEPLPERVNRGLTPAEVEILRELNASHRGWLSRDISDALLHRSHAKPFLPYYEEAATFCQINYSEAVSKVNERHFSGNPVVSLGIPPEEHVVTVTPDAELELYKIVSQISANAGARKAVQLQLLEAKALERSNPRRAKKLIQQTLQREPDCIEAQEAAKRLNDSD